MKFSFTGNNKFTVRFNSIEKTYPISAINCFIDESENLEPPQFDSFLT